MSGHSKWAQIKRQKGVNDVRRSSAFTKLANAITIAAKLSGVSDPDSSPRLRMAVDAARSINMPKENIQRAIDRGLGKLPGQTIEEVTYEGFGPGKVAFLIEGVTDNKMRTNSEIKNLFERSGGVLGNAGSTAYLFNKVGEIKVASKGEEKNQEMLELIDLGAEDVDDYQAEDNRMYLVYVQSLELNTMSNKITQLGYRVENADVVFKPNTAVEINDQQTADKLIEFVEKLEDQDDVQHVYSNFDVAENLI